ncbi:MAG: TolC family protein [Flavobacteriaceae bacterium]
MIYRRFYTGVFALLLLLCSSRVTAQETMDLEAFLNYVKAFHPLVKQADLKLTASTAKLLKSRGAFDPKIGVDYKNKRFKATPYYENLNATFTIPTYYGIEIQGGLQEASGNFVNPENSLSTDQLYSLGAEINLGKGLFANERQTALRQAKSYTQQAAEENALEVNAILKAASHAFLDWYQAHQEYVIFDRFVENAAFRFQAVKDRFRSGDLAAIDTTEARIAYNQRRLGRQKASLKLRQKALKASNFLWIDDIPVEIQSTVVPQLSEENFRSNFQPQQIPLELHPKIRALSYKQEQLVFEKRLQRNNLLPEIRLGYRWLSENNPAQQWNWALDPDNSTTQLKVSLPLFLRKERAAYRLADLKAQDMDLEIERTLVVLNNKIEALAQQSTRLQEQVWIAQEMASDYELLFRGEQKKFSAGESSLFLVNARESKWIEGLLKMIALETDQKKAQSAYYFELVFPVPSE